MAKGFILKGARGESAGFLQQAGGVLRCKARADGGEARLVIRFTDGSGDEQTLALDGREQEWPCAPGRTIACAYIAREDRLLLVTDDQARRAFEADRVRARRRSDASLHAQQQQYPNEEERSSRPHPEQEPRTAADARAKEETGGKAARTHDRGQTSPLGAAHALTERRWPPPPCWPSARYVSGRWTDS